MEGTVKSRRAIGAAILAPLVWGAILLALAGAELIFDPNLSSDLGDKLDATSVVLWLIGFAGVPAFAGTYAYLRGFGFAGSIGVAAFALLLFGIVTVIDIAIYNALLPEDTAMPA